MLKVIYPNDILKPFVEHFCVVETDDAIAYAPPQRIYPYGSIILLVHYRQASRFNKPNEAPSIEPNMVICGQQTSYYDLSLAGKTGMIFVVFKPYAAGLFFNLPMTEFKNENIALELLDKEAHILEDKIFHATCTKEKAYVLENFLTDQLRKNPYNELTRMLSAFRLLDQSAEVKVTRLAEAACLSPKQFERKFSELVGLRPKEYLRIARFQRIIKSSGNCDFLSLAFQNGFYDQSHFIHDFRSFTGMTPSDFFSTKSKLQ